MQIVDRNLRRSAMLLSVGGVLLLGLLVASLVLALRSQATFDRVVRDRELRVAAANLLNSLREVEIGYRGYLVTGDGTFLEPYRRALAEIPGREDALRLQAERNGAGTGLEAVDDLVDERLALVDEALDLADAPGGAGRAALLPGEERGKVAMDELRAVLDGFLDRTAIDFEGLLGEVGRLSRWNLAATAVGALATIAVVALAFATLARQLRALRRADIALRAMNQGLEERVQERTEDLVRANAEVQRFAYIVTHDLRAPLVNVMGFTSELEESLKALQAYVLADGGTVPEDDIRGARQAAAEDLPEALGFIRASTRKMDGLINAILKISRDGRRELRPESVDLAALAQSAIEAVAHQVAEARGQARVEAGVGAVVTDRLSLEQALGNLVDNAVKYADPGRPLSLVIRTLPAGPRRVRIEVEDNGRGVADADRERVFDLFRRAGRQDRPGEGIGLAHVRTLVRNLGGEVTLRSREGQGSVFAIELPADLRQVRAAFGSAPARGAAGGVADAA